MRLLELVALVQKRDVMRKKNGRINMRDKFGVKGWSGLWKKICFRLEGLFCWSKFSLLTTPGRLDSIFESTISGAGINDTYQVLNETYVR